MLVLGLDIGTTGLCALLLDSDSGEVLKTLKRLNSAKLESANEYEKIQDPSNILENCLEMVAQLFDEYEGISCIGVTGQMHGILYLDEKGNSLSPLYFWQDESGNQSYNQTQSYAEYLTDLTGYKLASGFGLVTYFVHKHKGKLPDGARKICTIHDYVAMKLSGRFEPLMHSSDAASLGMFDLSKLSFDEKAIEKADLDPKILPKVSSAFEILGFYNGKVPVCLAIGDNQASFIGSVKNTDESVLANVGTGSQLSFLSDKRSFPAGLELRPLVDDSFICVGSALCGGRAFALLENFFRQTLSLIGGIELESTYPPIYAFLDKALAVHDPLKVSSAFSGTRENPSERGSVENIGIENFTPGNLILAFLDAIAQELYDMYALSADKGKKQLIGSGGGLRKNHVLRSLFEEKFSMKIMIPLYEEEAAFGAALSAMVATGLKENLSAAQQIIRYL